MNYIVYVTNNKKFGVKKEGGNRATKTFDKKSDALKYAQALAKKSGGKVIDKTSSLETKVNKEIKKTKRKAKNKVKKFIISLIVFLITSAIGYISYYYFYDDTLNAKKQAVVGVTYDDLQFHFMQLGNNKNGDAIYIKAGDIDILIDAGVSDTTAIRKYMNPYITDNKLEYVIVTHADYDHIAGFYDSRNGIFNKYKIDTIIDFAYTTKENNGKTPYSKYLAARNHAVSKGAKHYTAKECYNEENGASRTYNLTNDISFEILWNNYYFENTTDSENDYSVITRFKYKEQYFLFTGDLEKDGEAKFVEHYKKENFPSVELYKAAHHGSKTSSNDDFLNLINPSISVVSCSAGNPQYTKKYLNTFPTQEYINRIAKHTDQVYVTSLYSENGEKPLNGNIVVSSNGTSVAVSCTNNTTKLKDSEWFNSNVDITETKELPDKNHKSVETVKWRTWPE